MRSKIRSLADHLGDLPDPRSQRGQRHNLLDIVLIAVLATMCGADSWEDIYRFAEFQEDSCVSGRPALSRSRVR